MMANAIRALSMDAVQKAKSGHPGMPMGMADIATALWSRHLRFNPTNPKWTGRDRFILSNGHGSMLQYALLHLTGYDLSIDDLKAFRQLHSKTPGHPEVDVTPGVETTTGPLGQGIANGVGMALAEKMLANEFNREGFPVFDNRTYVFLGDGCMMEGISHEVCSLAGDLPENWSDTVMDALCAAEEAAETVATRKASQKALNALAPALPELLGGSADLTGSNLTNWTGVKSLNSGDFLARHISYGVREFGMSAIMNGIALYGGFIPYAATFLTFSDYSRNALRMSSLMKQRVINVFTHDSIGLGEDGPTHQSVEHVPSLRLIPGMHVWRPADTVETIIAWASAIERRNGPSCLVFTRQNVPFLDRDEVDADAIARGAYVAAEAPAGAGEAEVVLLATGSEVGLAMKARAELTARNVQVRVVSMPCANLFDEQDEEYRRAVLPEGVPVLAIEASKSDLWYKYFSGKGAVIGVDTFGESAPACVLWERFGFTVENVVAKVEQLLK